MEELLTTQQEEEIRERALNLFRYYTGTNDVGGFTKAYVGHFPSRSAFGEQLLRETHNAEERLARLPEWLQGYLRIDGDAVATDFERSGFYRILELPDEGAFVFDTQAIDDAARRLP